MYFTFCLMCVDDIGLKSKPYSKPYRRRWPPSAGSAMLSSVLRPGPLLRKVEAVLGHHFIHSIIGHLLRDTRRSSAAPASSHLLVVKHHRWDGVWRDIRTLQSFCQRPSEDHILRKIKCYLWLYIEEIWTWGIPLQRQKWVQRIRLKGFGFITVTR